MELVLQLVVYLTSFGLFFTHIKLTNISSKLNGRRSHRSPQKDYAALSRCILMVLNSIGASAWMCKNCEVT
jgi:hypothetical protein